MTRSSRRSVSPHDLRLDAMWRAQAGGPAWQDAVDRAVRSGDDALLASYVERTRAARGEMEADAVWRDIACLAETDVDILSPSGERFSVRLFAVAATPMPSARPSSRDVAASLASTDLFAWNGRALLARDCFEVEAVVALAPGARRRVMLDVVADRAPRDLVPLARDGESSHRGVVAYLGVALTSDTAADAEPHECCDTVLHVESDAMDDMVRRWREDLVEGSDSAFIDVVRPCLPHLLVGEMELRGHEIAETAGDDLDSDGGEFADWREPRPDATFH